MKYGYAKYLKLVVLLAAFFAGGPSTIAQNGVRIAASAGTADPSAMLDVVSTNKGVLFPRVCLASLTANSSPVTNPQAGLVIYNTGACGIATTGLYFWNGSSWVFLNTGGFSAAGTTNYLPVFTASNALGSSVVYQSGSNVGIGTAAPAVKFQINNNFSNLNGRLLTSNDAGWAADGTTPLMVISDSYTDTRHGFKIGLDLHNDDASAYGGYMPSILFSRRSASTSYNTSIAGISAQAQGQGTDGNWIYGSLVFYTAHQVAYGLSEKMRIDQLGNVGIGTASPVAKLDVVGDIKVSGRLYGTGIASYAVARTQSSFTPPTSQSAANGSANEIPGLSVSITTHGGDIEISGTLFIQWNTTNTRGAFSASIDGAWVGAYIGSPWPATWANWYDGIIGKYAGGADWDTRTYHRVVTNVPAGTHTVKLLGWNESTNGWYINCCSMVSEMVVKELLKQN